MPAPGSAHSLGAHRDLIVGTVWTVSFAAGAHGSLLGPTSQLVPDGSAAAPVTAQAEAGYVFQRWTVGGLEYSLANPLTVLDVTGDLALVAVQVVDQREARAPDLVAVQAGVLALAVGVHEQRVVAPADALPDPRRVAADPPQVVGIVQDHLAPICRRRVVLVILQQAAAGVKPIVGADMWLENPADPHKPHRLVLLCQNTEGYRRLCRLLTRAYVDAIAGTEPRESVELRPQLVERGSGAAAPGVRPQAKGLA